jgi:hypothetical protein
VSVNSTAPAAQTAQRFIAGALANPYNRSILERLPALALPDAWLVAGCLFQSVWNQRSGRPPETGIKDYDLFYFDPADLSEAGEQAVQRRAAALFADLPIEIEACNQARVHLWYPGWFGQPYAALASSREGIGRFLVACTCVGLSLGTDALPELHAPNGLEDLYAGRLRPNPACDHRALFEAKAASYQSRWPWLCIEGHEPESDA